MGQCDRRWEQVSTAYRLTMAAHTEPSETPMPDAATTTEYSLSVTGSSLVMQALPSLSSLRSCSVVQLARLVFRTFIILQLSNPEPDGAGTYH